jgi:DNA-binding response OmpR family regulator
LSGVARVLVIDDEPDVLLLCRVNLSHAGHEVLESLDGYRGVELARAERPDAIVLDLMLPARDGVEVLGLLASEEETRDIPVMMLSAKTLRADRERCLAAGALAYLTKPFSPIELIDMVKTLSELTAEELDDLRSGARSLAG